MKNPLLHLACCFALGIVAAQPSRPPAFHLLQSVPCTLVAGAVGLLLGSIAVGAQWQRAGAGCVLAGFIFAGAAATTLFERRFPPQHVSHLLVSAPTNLEVPVRLEGRLVSAPLRTAYGLQFDVEATSIERQGGREPASGKIRLRLEASNGPASWAAIESLRLQRGDPVRVLVRLGRPRVYKNPGSFDFRRWMESIEDIYGVGTIQNPSLVEKLATADAAQHSDLWQAGASEIARGIETTRQRLLGAIDRLYPPWLPEGRDGSVLKAVLLGDRSSLDSDTIESFRKAGLYHLLVIAGLHVGLLAMLVAALLAWLGVRQTARSLIVLVFLLVYASLVEQRAPTLRATLMICVFLVARLLYRERSLLNAVGLAALVLLLWRPAWLFDSGFQLSFAAALLIAGLAVPILDRTMEPYRRGLGRLDVVELDPSLEPRVAQFRLDLRSLVGLLKSRFRFLDRHPAIARRLVVLPARVAIWTANILLFSAVLQLGLLLPMAETFHRVTYAGIGLNAIAIPVMTILLAVALPIVILAALAPGLAIGPARLVALMMRALFALTELPQLPAWLSYRVPEPPAWVAWGFAVSVIAAAWAMGRHARIFWGSLVVLAAFVALVSTHPFPSRIPTGVVEVTALDCDGGDALFIVLPDRKTMLVDAGGGRSFTSHEGAFHRGRWDPGEDIVSPYLWSRGVKKIDVLVLTDTREGRLSGVAAVVSNFRIGELWRAAHARAPYGPAYEEVFGEVFQEKIFVRELAAGDSIALGAASALVLWPPGASDGVSYGKTSEGGLAAAASAGEDSLALRISAGGVNLLLPGEMSGQVEQELVRSGVALESQLLKVARHGAKTSTTDEFLARVSPQVAIIATAGTSARNSPHPETLERLRAAGAALFRTDLDGAVTVTWQGGPSMGAAPAIQCYGRSSVR
jgi:competence protein ComEC